MDRSPRDDRSSEPIMYQPEPLPQQGGLFREEWPEALERRLAYRRPSGLPVHILWRGERIAASLGDLSAAGLSLRTEAALPVGVRIRVQFDGNARLIWAGSVVHCPALPHSLTGIARGSVGLELCELSPALEILFRD